MRPAPRVAFEASPRWGLRDVGPWTRSNCVMTRLFRRPTVAGVTLIELLCAMAIVALLATLLLGPALRALGNARAMQWADKAGFMTGEISTRLNQVFAGQTEFARVTLEKLEGDQLLTSSQVRFLKDKRVTFRPFSGRDPEGMIVIEVALKPGFLTSGGAITVTKEEITRVSK